MLLIRIIALIILTLIALTGLTVMAGLCLMLNSDGPLTKEEWKMGIRKDF